MSVSALAISGRPNPTQQPSHTTSPASQWPPRNYGFKHEQSCGTATGRRGLRRSVLLTTRPCKQLSPPIIAQSHSCGRLRSTQHEAGTNSNIFASVDAAHLTLPPCSR